MDLLIDYFNGDELAASAWKGKYAVEGETTPDDMHKRLAAEFARIEEKYIQEEIDQGEENHPDLSDYGKTRTHLTEKVIYKLFKNFKYIVPQGSIMAMLGHPTKIGSLSNCFVIGQPYDSYGGIMQKDEQMVQLMKRRGGVGLDLSTLRPSEVAVSNAAGSSTGAASFMHRFSNSTREVAQKGRRGALMLTMDVRHPDIFDFVSMKKDRTAVTGANISVLLRDDFMEAVENNWDYILRWPCDYTPSREDEIGPFNELYEINGRYFKRIKAKELYDQIVENAWENAEPGIMFLDRHWNYSPDTVYDSPRANYKGVTTNPCGEIFMGSYDACRLLAINMLSYVVSPFTDKAKFNYKKFYQHCYEQQRLADDLIDLELEHIDRIINKIKFDPEPTDIIATELQLWINIKKVCESSRRTGCGFTALGDTLAALNIKYDSEEAIEIVDKILDTKLSAELDCSIDLAISRGPFKGFDCEKEKIEDYGINRFLQNDYASSQV